MALTLWQKMLLEPYNRITESVMREKTPATDWKELKEVENHARVRTDIASHLRNIFLEAVQNKPKLILELGVKKGFSAFALSRAAMVTGATLVSVDNRDFSKSLDWKDWIFVHMDDLQFAKQFPSWCQEKKINPVIDVLFIDTSHEYEHTKKEIAAFFPFLAADGKVIFHDTNCADWYRRRDFTVDRSYDAKRQVIKALEEYFNKSFDEKKEFTEFIDGWLIKHDPICNGLTIIQRVISDR